MKNIFFTLCLFIANFSHAQQPDNLKLWYAQPATRFEEALPLGNGRLGMMLYGGVRKETINLNEESLWGGGPTDTKAPDSSRWYLNQVREQLFTGKWADGSRLLRHIQGANSQSFIPMGNIFIEQRFNNKNKEEIYSNYKRDLDLASATAHVSFRVDTVDYERESFVSAPDQVAVIRYRALSKGQLNLYITGNTAFENASIQAIGADEFVLRGQAPADVNSARNFPLVYRTKDGRRGMRYQYRIRAILKDGTVTTDPGIQISGATEVMLIISAATSFNGFDKRPDMDGRDEEQLATSYLEKVKNRSFDDLRSRHVADYQLLFDRVHLNLGVDGKAKGATDERLKKYAQGNEDSELESLYFNFGRYLLISSSRPGGVAANLQGIWNHNQRPSWGSNFTTNINVQMNYWPAEMLNLAETVSPLIEQIKNLSVTGKQVARNYYDMGGWAAHHNSDIWAHANPVGHKKGDPKWANWSLGSPWLSQHLYTHYQYSLDTAFLKNTAYPLMKGAADFCIDWLVEKDGYWVTAPSTSPENVFIDDKGKKGVVTIASTMDMQIIWDLLNNLIEASTILQVDKVEREQWKKVKDKLYPMRIGKAGNLIEWYKDWQDEDPEHRHVSHLFGLHPGRQISPLLTPELAKASRKSLDTRGDGGTGWSKAWKVNFQARLLDGEHAYKMYRELLSSSTLPNLFDTHPPFQIDGNFGGISGVGEMLLQSHLNELHLLPAIPLKWKQGQVTGLKARGGYTIDIRWDDGKITSGCIYASASNQCHIRTTTPIKISNVSYKSRKDGQYFVTSFRTHAGGKYLITR